MVDFSSLSDSDDEKAVSEIISQAMDQCVLEQVAAINCSGFSDSALPTHLERRFQKLKSFPSTARTNDGTLKNTSASFNSARFSQSKEANVPKVERSSQSADDEKAGAFKDSIENPPDKMGLAKNSKSGPESLASEAFENLAEDELFAPCKKNPGGKVGRKSKSSKAESFSSPSDSWSSSSRESLSPPKSGGCFWCSPKKTPRRKSHGIRGMDMDPNWGRNDILSDLNTFSSRSQQKMLRKAMKEEEKVSREAEKIVKWAKQASARMDVSGLEGELSDNEILK